MNINNLRPHEQERVIAFARELAQALRRIKADQKTEVATKTPAENDQTNNKERRDDEA